MKIRYPAGNILLRSLSRDYPIVSHGKGMYLFDTDGKRYLDAVGGAFVVSVGHGNEEVVANISAQLSKVAYLNGTQFTSEPAEQLATRLSKIDPALGLNRSFFLCSGSEAVEAALKLARQLWMDRGEPQKYKLIARTPGYHGNTLYALSASGRPHYRKLFGPMLHDIALIPAPYEYRSQVSDYKNKGGEHYAKLLEDAIIEAGPSEVAAFLFEPIIGSSAGASLPPPGYFEKVQAICKKHKVLIIADEVLCGSGRTGKFFASSHFGLKPDILVLGKGIGGGYIPLSVVLTKDEYVQEIKAKSGYFSHAQTYMQSPSMVAAGCAVLDYFDKHRVLENCTKVGEIFIQRLREEISTLPHVGFVTGKGLLAGVEFVEDKALKTPFDRTKKVAESLAEHAFQQGLVLWPNVGQADGVNGDLIMLAPPLNIGKPEVEEIVAAVKKTILSFFR